MVKGQFIRLKIDYSRDVFMGGGGMAARAPVLYTYIFLFLALQAI